MSIANILVANKLALFCGTLNGFTVGAQGQFIGPQGTPGIQGAQGLVGAGVQGPMGIAGVQGNFGLQGVIGIQGSAQVQLNVARYSLTTSVQTFMGVAEFVIYDTAGLPNSRLSYNAGTGIFTVNVAGVYTFTALNTYATDAGGTSRNIWFSKNFSSIHTMEQKATPLSTSVVDVSTAYTDFLNIGDQINVYAFQDSPSSSVNLVGSASNATDFCAITISIITLT